MKKLYLFTILITANFFPVNAQDNYSGKYFVETLMVEKASPCYKIEYCVLKFSKDSVEVSYPIKTYCNTVELSNKQSIYNVKPTKKYKWKIIKEKLCIPGFENFNLLTFEEKTENFINDLYTQQNKP